MTIKHRDVWVDYLRAAITVLVVAHHASLSYTTFAAFNAEAYVRSTHPVVDERRWLGLDIFQNFNDIFFMSLMFMISGFFVPGSLQRKGARGFITDRIYRLFVPFVAGATVLAFVTYYPPFRLAHGTGSLTAFLQDFFTTEAWPAGPVWFIWILLAFNLAYVPLSRVCGNALSLLGKRANVLGNKPVQAAVWLIIITWTAFTPLAYSAGAGTWTGWQPFDFQLSRIVLYFTWFLLGSCLGMGDFNKGLFAVSSRLVRNWKVWALLALLTFGVIVLISNFELLGKLVVEGKMNAFTGWMIYFAVFSISCSLSSIAFMTAFRALASKRAAWWDNLVSHAYLIYLIHYSFVIWLQYLLVNANLPAFLKFLLVFSFSLSLSWFAASLLKKVPFIRKYM